MSVVGPLLGLVAFLAAVVVLLAIVVGVATVVRMGRDRREAQQLVREAEAALREVADGGSRQE